jgi:hypothetical protein
MWKGRPSTPRDGAAIEINGLACSVLHWLSKVASTPLYTKWTNLLKTNFEKMFWNDSKKIYRDTLGASYGAAWDDMLRPNAAVALSVVPEDFVNIKNARQFLEEECLRLVGPLGMCTLDPRDCNYRGDYDNSNDGTDPTTAHGANYHQGPGRKKYNLNNLPYKKFQVLFQNLYTACYAGLRFNLFQGISCGVFLLNYIFCFQSGCGHLAVIFKPVFGSMPWTAGPTPGPCCACSRHTVLTC